MNSSPLIPKHLAYETARDSFRIAKRAIKKESHKESEDLFVLALWATFERFLRDDLQKRGQILCNANPPILGTSIYKHFEKEVEFWKSAEILDFLKDSLFKNKPDLIYPLEG